MAAKASPQSSVKVKKEVCPSDDIKEFAETAMNELLGWYGYDKVDRGDIVKTTSRSNITISMAATRANRKPVEMLVNDSSCSNGAPGHVESSLSDRDSSRESSKSPPKTMEKIESDCTWCRKTISPNSTEVIGSPDGPIFCTESCFAQSRRASFKRAKTCDWCRHIRHAVSYVDFQDGASQLQFCSDKCLNQYKMQIFCKETQAHLDMNPHLKEKGGNSSGSLITPELWLKNCKSRSATPTSERSRSPSPRSNVSPPSPNIPSTIPTPSITIECSKKPLISVAPVSKLLNRPPPAASMRQGPRMMKRRRSQKQSHEQHMEHPQMNHNHHHNNNNNNNNNIKLCMPNNAQDLRILGNNQRLHAPENVQIPRPQSHHPFLPPPPNLFPLRGVHPRGPRFPPQQSSAPPGPPPHDIPSLRFPSAFGLPPVTVLVPYPIILPLPIPIPIPLPILKPQPPPEPTKTPETKTPEPKTETEEEPIDYTKHITPDAEPSTPNEEQQPESPESTPSTSKEEQNAEQKLPKFKITRLAAKRILSKEAERESSRPLRKRKCLLQSEQHQIVEVDKKKP